MLMPWQIMSNSVECDLSKAERLKREGGFISILIKERNKRLANFWLNYCQWLWFLILNLSSYKERVI